MATIAMELLRILVISSFLGLLMGETTVNASVKTTRSTGNTTLPTTALEISSSSYGFCAAYCNVYGYYMQRRYCTPPKNVCCYRGTYNDRECCEENTGRVPPMEDVKTCSHTFWWVYNWKTVVAFLGTIMLVMMFGACIYYCCMGLCRNNQSTRRAPRWHRHNSDDDHHMNTISGSSVTDSGQRNSFSFDPSNPNAFEPPPYDSLPKDPPRYTDIFTENGQVNPAFEVDTPMDSAAASSSMAAAEEAIADATSRGATGAAVGATGGATASAPLVDEILLSASNPATPNTSLGASPPVPGPSLDASSSSRNRTRDATPIPAVSRGVPQPMSDAFGDYPPPYTREDPSLLRTPPSGGNPNPARDTQAISAITSPSGDGPVQRIMVGERVSPES